MIYLQRLFWGIVVLGIIGTVGSIIFIMIKEPIFTLTIIGGTLLAYSIGTIIDKAYKLP